MGVSRYLTVFFAYLYVLFEWLFIITKPSYLNYWSFPKKVGLYLFTSSLLAILLLIPLIALHSFRFLPGMRKYPKMIERASLVVAALVLASLALMLVDNFTYTVMKFGIVRSSGPTRGVYGLLFLAFMAYYYRTLWRNRARYEDIITRTVIRKWGQAGLAALIILSFAGPVAANGTGPGPVDSIGKIEPVKRPHILYIISDGVDAEHMSSYGYKRNTTPYLSKLAQSSLVFENVFSNMTKSSGSTIATFTSKYPAQTRVLIQPDILQGQDAYLHLPGMLRAAGYRTVEYSFPYYVDANGLNLLDGFDSANGRSFPKDGLVSTVIRYAPTDFAYFLLDMSYRLIDRLKHIFFIKEVENPYSLVAWSSRNWSGSRQMEDLLELLDNQRYELAIAPLFVHLHLMGSHGPNFHIQNQVFSRGKDLANLVPYDDDVYDDAIREFDINVQRIVNALKANGMYENTILVIGSDHGEEYIPEKRIPLLIRFPGGEHAGRVTTNVQNMDIAPTLLDYLGVQIPDWMEGRSLLDKAIPNRPIFIIDSVNTNANDKAFWEMRPQVLYPPFYRFGSITVIYCRNWYQYNLYTHKMDWGDIDGSTADCSNGSVGDGRVFGWMVSHLKQYGFDTASIEVTQTAQVSPDSVKPR